MRRRPDRRPPGRRRCGSRGSRPAARARRQALDPAVPVFAPCAAPMSWDDGYPQPQSAPRQQMCQARRRPMRAVCQRVSEARVRVVGSVVGEIGAGLVVLLGVARGDEAADAERLAAKVARLRIFEGETGKFDVSLLDTGGSALVVSQFTLIADSKRQKGTRPDFSRAAPRDEAEPLFEAFCDGLR